MSEPLPGVSELLLEASHHQTVSLVQRARTMWFSSWHLGDREQACADPERVHNKYLTESVDGVNGYKQSNHIHWYLSGSLKIV